MELVIGGAYQGKLEYVKRNDRMTDEEICCCETLSDLSASGPYRCLNGLHKIIENEIISLSQQNGPIDRKEMISSSQQNGPTDRKEMGSLSQQNAPEEVCALVLDRIDALLKRLRGPRSAETSPRTPELVVICDEVGGGIVPADRRQRDYRECVGRVLCGLAQRADTVVRVQCGIGSVLKYTVRAAFIRHGATASNLAGRYLGAADEPLCEAGIEMLQKRKGQNRYPGVRFVVSAPAQRCLQSAGLLYPGIPVRTEPAFRETDFGLLEGRNYEELMADDSLRGLYQAWIDSGGVLPFPQGESAADTAARCGRAFERLLPSIREDTAFVLHGGTIMALLHAYAGGNRNYHAYQCGCGEGYLCRLELTGDGALYRLAVLDRI